METLIITTTGAILGLTVAVLAKVREYEQELFNKYSSK